MDSLTLRWHGHACFTLTWEGFTIVFDPYQDNYVPGLAPLHLEADLVLCSHLHGDHNATELVRPLQGRTTQLEFYDIDTFHDPEGGHLRGENTIRLIKGKELSLAHFGDLGCPLTSDEIDQLKGVDVALLPVGGFYTIDAAQAKEIVDAIQPRVVIPMHYRMEHAGLPNIAPVEDFLNLAGPYTQYPGDTITVTPETPRQVAVLTYQG